MNSGKRIEPAPGEILQRRDWSPAEIEDMKMFIQEKEPGLWEQLVEVQNTTSDFTDLEITRRVDKLIRERHPLGGRLDPQSMFLALRRVWEKY